MRVFHKAYTRDNGMIIQESWSYAFTGGFEKITGKGNPITPSNIYFANNGANEIWDCKESLQWLMDKLLEKNKQGHEFFDKNAKTYQELLDKLEEYKKQGVLSSIDELKKFVEEVERGRNGS